MAEQHLLRADAKTRGDRAPRGVEVVLGQSVRQGLTRCV
jgi:hypothetical protein